MNGLIRQDNVVTIPFWSQAQYRKYRIIEHNDLLKGTEFLGELIESALNHQPLNLLYRTFAGKER